MRINKYIALCGVASRRKAEELILAGKIKVNDNIVTELSYQVDEENDVVKVDDKIIKEELLRELRLKTPDEIKRYQKIISNKDAILADAQNKADAIIAEAQAKAREMVEQSEVMQSAYAQANETVNNANQQAQEILDAATNDANSIRLGAIGYTDDMLANLSNIMTTALNDAGEKYNSFVESLTSCYNTVVQNRSELSPQGAPEEEQPEEEVVVPEYDPASEEESEEE